MPAETPTPLPACPDAALVERVARALMEVRAERPCGDGRKFPILALDPDFDDLPANHFEGTEDDEITQEAVLALAKAAVNVCAAAWSRRVTPDAGVREALELVLPMAKGYAAANAVGSNSDYIKQADAALASTPPQVSP